VFIATISQKPNSQKVRVPINFKNYQVNQNPVSSCFSKYFKSIQKTDQAEFSVIW
jgi:hypothetical protein